MDFLESTVKLRFDRQQGKCAACGKALTWENQDKGTRGAWHAHHIDGSHRNNTLSNCAILCINEPNNCHLNVGHSGDYKKGRLAPKSKLTLKKESSIWDW